LQREAYGNYRKGVIVIMLLAPVLTKIERDALVERCPEAQRWAFAGWLKGTHELDGSLIEPGLDAAASSEVDET
jgi:hypothetical protein